MLHMTATYISAYLKAHITSDRGASLVEYALLIALIAIVCIGAVTLLGGEVQEPYAEITSGIG